MTDWDRRPLLIVPAAGAGSRLKAGLPKFLVPVGGRPMIQRLAAMYEPFVSRFVVVVAPALVDEARARVSEITRLPLEMFKQARPTGMLDAVLLARPAVEASDAERVWVTWCDQLAVDVRTIERLASDHSMRAPLTMPVIRRRDPYIHYERDGEGRISAVLQRREGDRMPAVGEGDVGLFSFSRRAYLEELPKYAAALPAGAMTGERNLLPFIPWLAARGDVETFDCVHETEAIGINTPEDLQAVEAHLAARDGR